MKYSIETGQKYGNLTVKNKTNIKHKSRKFLYYCKCDCGGEKLALASNLRLGKVTSCGCQKGRGGKLKSLGDEGRKRALYKDYQRNISKKNLTLSITFEEFLFITQQDCYYCGEKPFGEKKSTGGKYVYSGIDRVDNDRGYHMDNIVPCCKICNYSKRNLAQGEFLNWVEKVYNKCIMQK